MDPAVARCVLSNLERAGTRAAAGLLLETCATLVGQGQSAPAPDGGDYLTRCYVPGDPEWVEFRLLTRGQCRLANGVPAR
jgi:hypothetical protein